MTLLEIAMIGIDTNILVRFITQDDSKQAEIASKFLAKYSDRRSYLFVSNVVVCELIWVLTRAYKYPKRDILDVLEELFSSMEFAFEDINLLFNALVTFEESDAEFPDTLISHIHTQNRCTKTYSFNKTASKLANWCLL